MTIAAYSATASEAEYIRKGRFKLYFENDLLNISDGTNIISLDLSHSALINWTPDTTCLYPAFPNGSALTTLNNLLSSIINNIELNTGEISYKSDLDHTHTTTDITDLLTWFNNKKPELKGDDGRDGQDGKSAFELWQLDIYGNIEPKNTTHPNNWQYIDPSGFGDKSNVRLLTYRNEYESRLNLFMKETGKNALELEDKADEILNTIDYGMTEEEIQAIRDRANEKLNEITEGMTDEEVEAITNEANAILATIDYGMSQEQIQEIQNQYAAKKAEWINWQQDKHYDFSLIFKEISGYPGDNPTEWELRQYTYRLYQAGDINAGTVQNIGDIEQAQTTAERAEETAKTAKKLGIAGTVLGAIGTVFGIGNTAAEVVSYSSLQSQIATLTASMGTIQSSYLLNNFDEFSDVITESYDDITGTGGIWSKIGNFFKNIWENITGLRVGYTEIGEVMSEGGEILADVDAVLLGVRTIRTREHQRMLERSGYAERDLSEPVQHYTLTEDFTKWYIQQYPSMNSILSAIKLIFESNNYDYTTKEASLRIIYLIAAELLDKIETNETHTHTISEITDYTPPTPYNDLEIKTRLSAIESLITYENITERIKIVKEEETINEEEEDVYEIIDHPTLTFNDIETLKKTFNGQTKTIAYAEDVAPLNHNHDSAYAAINHNHNNDYAAINHTHTTFNNLTVSALNVNSTAASATYINGITCLNNNLSSGHEMNILIGKASSSGKSGYIGYCYHATDPFMSIGFHSFDRLFNIYKNRVVSVNNITAPNLLSDNETRLSAAETAITGKADINHNHDTAYAAINHNHDTDYAALSHTHTLSEITDYTAPTAYDDTQLRTLINGKADTSHTHNISDISNLSTTITDINNLISNKADNSMLTALTTRVAIVETNKADSSALDNYALKRTAKGDTQQTETIFQTINQNHPQSIKHSRIAINESYSYQTLLNSDKLELKGLNTALGEQQYFTNTINYKGLTLSNGEKINKDDSHLNNLTVNDKTINSYSVSYTLEKHDENHYFEMGFSMENDEKIIDFEPTYDYGVDRYVQINDYYLKFYLEDTQNNISKHILSYHGLAFSDIDDNYIIVKGADYCWFYIKNFMNYDKFRVEESADNVNYVEVAYTNILTNDDKITTNNIADSVLNVKTLLNLIYPVGAIYTSMNNIHPKLLFGFGTWKPITNKFMYCAETQSEQIGGSATHTHTTGNHILTINEMPSHNHKMYYANSGSSDNNWGYSYASNGARQTANYDPKTSTGMLLNGGNQPHNHGDTGSASNLPPFITIYAWYRSA